jgi:hypothetical protein
MPEYVTREEFDARVGVIEQEVDGEKLVTRHILEQTRRNGDELASVKTRLGRVESQLDSLGGKFDALHGSIQGVVKNLPGIIRNVMREVPGDRDRKK